MILDSILVSLWQAKYFNNNQITEEKTVDNIMVNGFSWLNNDGVNLLANILVVGLVVFILMI